MNPPHFFTPDATRAVDRQPLVTVFVQVYNTQRYIRQCLESVCDLEGDYPVEIIIIDDGSEDKSWGIIESFCDDRIEAIRHDPNQGANVTANKGYQLARGKYVVRLDSDDRLRPSFLTQAIPILEANPEIGFVYGDIALIDEEDVIQSESKNLSRPPGDYIRDEFFEILIENYVPAPTTLARTEAIRPLLPIPSKYHFLDWYITTGIAERWKVGYVDFVQADYRVHESNMHRTMLRDRSGERVTFQVLDALFESSFRAEEKRRNHGWIYGENYLVLAEKYFGADLTSEAKRCYCSAIRHYPRILFRLGVMRRFAATLVGKQLYDRTKKVFQAI